MAVNATLSFVQAKVAQQVQQALVATPQPETIDRTDR